MISIKKGLIFNNISNRDIIILLYIIRVFCILELQIVYSLIVVRLIYIKEYF